jgi:AbrB family looped-hinge helix DNA binding protein
MVVREWVPLDRVGSAKVGPKGQIVIPKAMRDRAGMAPGGTVFLRQAEDGSVTIEYAWNDLLEAPDYFARFPVQPGMEGKTALDILHELDAEDEALHERKYGSWPTPPGLSTPSPSSPSSAAKPTGSGSGRSSRRPRDAKRHSD